MSEGTRHSAKDGMRHKTKCVDDGGQFGREGVLTAPRGLAVSNASSPKKSPGMYSISKSKPALVAEAVPDLSRYIDSPASPSLMISAPSVYGSSIRFPCAHANPRRVSR